MLIKACGIKTLEDIDMAGGLQYNTIGIVLHPESSRYCNEVTTAKLISYSRRKYPEMMIVAVIKYAHEVFYAEDFDYIQSHDNRYNSKLINMIPFEKNLKNYFLYDISEGSGVFNKFPDWLGNYNNIIIAGGLTAENVGKVIQDIKPAGVDVSSGIETNGSKDYKKMKDFIEEVKDANRI